MYFWKVSHTLLVRKKARRAAAALQRDPRPAITCPLCPKRLGADQTVRSLADGIKALRQKASRLRLAWQARYKLRFTTLGEVGHHYTCTAYTAIDWAQLQLKSVELFEAPLLVIEV